MTFRLQQCFQIARCSAMESDDKTGIDVSERGQVNEKELLIIQMVSRKRERRETNLPRRRSVGLQNESVQEGQTRFPENNIFENDWWNNRQYLYIIQIPNRRIVV